MECSSNANLAVRRAIVELQSSQDAVEWEIHTPATQANDKNPKYSVALMKQRKTSIITRIPTARSDGRISFFFPSVG